jgi:hypothetical protein
VWSGHLDNNSKIEFAVDEMLGPAYGAIQIDLVNCAVTYYADADGDGYGNPAVSVASCTPVAGYVTSRYRLQ